uniref:Kinesin-like protein n=1 Tax=Callorhinchus milii TaxID=7868 RepID=A0A4W3I710_CALMI
MSGQETVVQHPETNQIYAFVYDFSFWSFDELHPEFSSQESVYKIVGSPLLEKAFQGYNACLFAYGQTGSGKSYTMMGFGDEGIIPRFCQQLFASVANPEMQQVTYHIEMSYFEVYNERIHDLLTATSGKAQVKQSLRIREHPVYGPYVGWLELGNKQRATAATGMNEKSSRSHSVFTLVMTQTKTEFVEEEEHEHSVTSRVNLVDLAGSERCFTAQTSGERLKEGVSINKSLFTLGKVICALSEQSQSKKKIFVPYRESVLTWLLKDSIGGNSKTAMIATVSPSASNVEETLSTLRYAKRARQIINIAKVNEDSNAKLIRDLKAEIENLRAAQMSSQGIQSEKYKVSQKEIGALKLKLSQQEREMAEVQRRWREKLDQAEKRKLEEARELQKAGITFKVDNSLPNLVNLNEDPQISEMLLYMIKEGRTRVGKHKPNSTHDIQLSGALIADDHCIIQNLNSTVMIAPIGDAKTYVNGNLITDSTVLHHGDRVILGGDHYFKFNHPVEVQSGRRASCANALLRDGPKDFEFAKNELLQAQQARLEAEIEEAQLQAKREMMQGIQVAKEMAQKELSSQKSLYENKIKDLEKELEKEACKKKLQELNTKKAVSKMEELQDAKRQLEQKVELNRKRLQMETLAAKQALKDHNIHHAKFLAALEAEKRKMTEDLQKIQKERNKRLQTKSYSSDWSSMKLSMMIQEANTISKNLRKCTVFSRSVSPRNKSVQVRNTKLGISTYWSLEKFDFFRSKRMSGCLSEIRNTPLQNLQSAHPTGYLLNISRSICSAGAQSSLPAVCKELLGAAVDYLGRNHLSQETIPDRLLADLLTIQTSTCAIANAYEQLDDESQENLFTNNTEMQSHCIKITTNLERVAILMKLWVDKALPQGTCSEITDDELLGEVKTLGRNLQLLLKGCDSDISSMVTEAQNRISQTIRRVMKHVGHLATFTGVALHFEEQNLEDSLSYKVYHYYDTKMKQIEN